MAMLSAYLHEQEKHEAWKAYTAQMLWYSNYAMYANIGKKFDHPTWLDMVQPQRKDDRSGQEIVGEVKEMLMQRKRKREGGK